MHHPLRSFTALPLAALSAELVRGLREWAALWRCRLRERRAGSAPRLPH